MGLGVFQDFKKVSVSYDSLDNLDAFNKSAEFNVGLYTGNHIDPSYYRPINVVGYGFKDYSYVVPFEGLKYCEDLFDRSADLKNIITQLISETFRNGMTVKSKFDEKCKRCGELLYADDDICSNCGSRDLIKPNKFQEQVLRDKMEIANFNNQSMKEVLRDISYNLNVFDNAYVVARKSYEYDKNNKIASAQVKEVMSGNIYCSRLIMSRDGRMGMTPDGSKYMMSCPYHRDISVKVNKDKVNDTFCPECGRQMMKAHLRFEADNVITHYLDSEVLHLKKFGFGIGYGFPVILTLSRKITILIAQDEFIGMAYEQQRPPRLMFIIKAGARAVQKAWNKLQEMTMVNPHAVAPFVVEDVPNQITAKNIAEVHDLSFKVEEFHLDGYRQELRRQIGAMYGVSPIFQGDISTSGGLNNEGLQLTVTNRAVETEHELMNKALSWIVKQYGVTDWIYRMNPYKEIDSMAVKVRNSQELDNALKLEQLGHKTKIRKNDAGEYETVIMGKKDSEEGSKTPSSLTGLFGGGKK